MVRIFAVIRTEGPAWDVTRPLEGQRGWDRHAAYMEALVREGFIVIGGPLEGTADRLLVVRARSPEEIARALASDPWSEMDILRTTRIAPWTIRLGSLPG
jgi:uncharacterized protein YciI